MAIVSFIFYKNYKASIFTYIIVYESSPLLGELEEAFTYAVHGGSLQTWQRHEHGD